VLRGLESRANREDAGIGSLRLGEQRREIQRRRDLDEIARGLARNEGRFGRREEENEAAEEQRDLPPGTRKCNATGGIARTD